MAQPQPASSPYSHPVATFRLRTSTDELPLVGLPWDEPLEAWPDELSVSMPAGSHRHVVRFIELGGRMLALKELPDRLARREYDMLERLRDENLPGVTLTGIVTGRHDRSGGPLDGVLITRHLRYSLPYRLLFSEPRHIPIRDRLIDALVALLVRLHTAGFLWGDCSLNNALFRRDAGALRAYVVDTETAEWHDELTDGQRNYDLDIATENVIGGLLDLDAQGLLDSDLDPETIADQLGERYRSLWAELHETQEIPTTELGLINARLARLNDLGFDTEEYELESSGGLARFRPTVVEEGHHRRTLQQLTGIVAHENQARRLLSAMRAYGAWLSQIEGERLPEAVVAYRWLKERYQVALELVPEELQTRLEDPEIYHEILEHNWYLNERSDDEILLEDATRDYVEHVLSGYADESTVLELADRADRHDTEVATEGTDDRNGHDMVSPPDTDNVWPVVKPAPSEAK